MFLETIKTIKMQGFHLPEPIYFSSIEEMQLFLEEINFVQ